MKALALSVRQPWASLIVWGLKSVEIRSWTTRHRGLLLIHASKTVDEDALRRFRIEDVPTGCLIGAVELAAVEEITPATWRELSAEHLASGPFAPGLYAWRLAGPRPLDPPVPWTGQRFLFEVTLDHGLVSGKEA